MIKGANNAKKVEAESPSFKNLRRAYGTDELSHIFAEFRAQSNNNASSFSWISKLHKHKSMGNPFFRKSNSAYIR